MKGNRRVSAVDLLAPILIVAGLGAALGAPVILFIELFEWLTSSEWAGLTLADGLSAFGIAHETPESETQRLTDLLMAAPLTAALFVVGIYLSLAGASLGSWERERQLFEELKEKSVFYWMTVWGASDVSYITAFRLLFLDVFLGAVIWLGAGLVAGELILLALGILTPWPAISGILVILAAASARTAVRRKLPADS